MSRGKGSASTAFDGFQKRSGLVVPFSWQKIELAIDRAVEEIARKQDIAKNEGMASKVTDIVLRQLNSPQSEFYVYADDNGQRIPRIEDVQDLVEIVLAEQGETLVVAAYKRYRKQREMARRNIRVRGENVTGGLDTADSTLLLVESSSQTVNLPWDRKRIVKQILEKTDLSVELAINVAKSVENRIIAGDLNTISTTLIRELVNNELMERGYSQQLRDLSLYRVSKDYLDQLLNSKNQNNNPDAVDQSIAKLVLKQWALDTIYNAETKRAHDTGVFHLHGLGEPTRLSDSLHSIEYIKKFGLNDISMSGCSSSAPRSASVLNSQLNAFIDQMKPYFSGSVRLDHLNIFYAPLLKELNATELKQIAQDLIFNTSRDFGQNSGISSVDFNLYADVPEYLKNVPAIGPKGRYQLGLKDGSVVELNEELRELKDSSGNALMDLYYNDPEVGKRLVLRELSDERGGVLYDPDVVATLEENGEEIVTYADYSREVQEFCLALLLVFGEGDSQNRSFKIPKCIFHISGGTFENTAQAVLLQEASRIAAKNGSIHFRFDRNETALTLCSQTGLNRTLRHPESRREFSFQTISINIPQASYRAAQIGGDIMKNFYDELDRAMELAVDAHLQKKSKTAEMIDTQGQPLRKLGKLATDGTPYINLDLCTYGIGLVGVNDAVNFLIGQELHSSKDAQRLGLKVAAYLCTKAKKLTAKHGLTFALVESPSDAAAIRLAKSDLVYFPEDAKDIVKGSKSNEFYTHSAHLSAKANLSIAERVTEQSKYHCMIDLGANTQCFTASEQPDAASIAALITEAYHRTQAAQLCISPALTRCGNCHHQSRGLHDKCPACGAATRTEGSCVASQFGMTSDWSSSRRYQEMLNLQTQSRDVSAAGLVSAE